MSQEMDAAKGGLVLKRLQSWAKDDPDKDGRTPMGTGQMGPQDNQDYSKGGPESNDDDGDEPKRTGDKSLPMSSLKKKG
jgi:hypothetical protein